MAVSKAAIGATAGTGTAAAAATTALTVGGGASGEKISDSFDSVSEPSINDESDVVNEPSSPSPKATEKTLDETANLKDASDPVPDEDRVPGGPSAVDEVSNQGQKVEGDVKGPEVLQKTPDELVKEEIDNKSSNKQWNLTNNVFISDVYSNYCLQRLFVDEIPEDETSGINSPNNYKVFEGNDRKVFGCLGARYLRMNKSGSTHWKGISFWGWGIRKGDEGFMYLAAFKNQDDDGKKIKYFSKTFHMKKVDGTWENKYYKEVNGITISISDSSKKIPKGGSVLSKSNEDYAWGLYSDATINKACGLHSNSRDSNCDFYFSKSGDLEEKDSTKYWFWEEGTGNNKFKDMQSNFDEWWSEAFPDNALELKGVHDKEGSWIEWD